MKNIIFILATTCLLFAEDFQITSNGEERTFKAYFPDNSSENLPMVILMHGQGETVYNMIGLSNYYISNNIIPVFPQANVHPTSDNGDSTTVWNVRKYDTMSDDVAFIEDMIIFLTTTYNLIDQNKIYAAGYSNGGYMAYRLSCDLSDKIAAFGSVCGNMYLIDDNIDCTEQGRDIPIIHIHGTLDNINPYYEGGYGIYGNDIIGDEYLTILESIEFWSSHNQLYNETVDTIFTGGGYMWFGEYFETSSIKFTYSNDFSNTKFTHIRAVNGGHVWFYGDNWGFDSHEELLNFFMEYNLNNFTSLIGDFNSDGILDINDLNILIDHILESNELNETLDLNSDSKADIFDLFILTDLINR